MTTFERLNAGLSVGEFNFSMTSHGPNLMPVGLALGFCVCMYV